MSGITNPDATRIWDEAEVYVIARNAVTDITELLPATIDDELDARWEFVGLLDGSAGIPVNPEIEITHFDAYGQARYRSKAKKGAIGTAFTALEKNSVTKKFVLPGSSAGKIGAPKGMYFHTAYVLRDEDIATEIWVSTRPALFELGSFSKVEGEPESYEITVHHSNDSSGDVFFVVDADTSAAELAITTVSLPAGVVGTPYSQTLTATGGVGAKTWSKTGTLPVGLTLSADGVLSGTPTAAGTPSITLKVIDSASPSANTATKAITVTVTA